MFLLVPFLTGVNAASCGGEDCGGEGEVPGARGVVSVGGPWLIPTFSATKSCNVLNRVFSSVYLLFPSSTISSCVLHRVRIIFKFCKPLVCFFHRYFKVRT